MFPTKETPAFGIFVKNQVTSLIEHGYTVHVAAIQDPEMGKFHVLKKYSSWLLGSMRRLLTAGKSYDVVHAHYAFPSGMIARWFKKWANVPYVVTCHGGDLNKMAKKGPFFRKQTEKILKDADHVITVGHDLERQVTEEYGLSKTKVSVLSMGVNRNVFFSQEKTAIRNKLDVNENLTNLLFVGNIIKEKGMEDLIQALSIIKKQDPTIHLHVVGQAKQESYLQFLHERIKELQIEETVTFHGPKTQKEVAEWMNAADIFVLPSHIEGFGLVAVEAMACGTPVVGTDTGGLSYLLKGDTGSLAVPKSPSSIAEAINRVTEDDNYRQHLISNGKQKAAQNDSSTITDRVITIYEEAMEKTGESK